MAPKGVVTGDETVGEEILDEAAGNNLTEGPVFLAGRVVGTGVGGGGGDTVGDENVDEGENSLTEGPAVGTDEEETVDDENVDEGGNSSTEGPVCMLSSRKVFCQNSRQQIKRPNNW